MSTSPTPQPQQGDDTMSRVQQIVAAIQQMRQQQPQQAAQQPQFNPAGLDPSQQPGLGQRLATSALQGLQYGTDTPEMRIQRAQMAQQLQERKAAMAQQQQQFQTEQQNRQQDLTSRDIGTATQILGQEDKPDKVMSVDQVEAQALQKAIAEKRDPNQDPTLQAISKFKQSLQKPQGTTEADEDQRFEKIDSAQRQKQPVSPEDASWAESYKKRKTLGPTATAVYANTRQDKSEDFTMQEKGRDRISKIEGDYNDAAEKADTLRSVVTAAAAGNKVAGSVQTLLATLGLTTMEGVKRINTTELQNVAGAGDLLDRIRGAAGKLTEGQPIPPDLQADIKQLADILQKSAYTKYVNNHKTITKRYGLTDEQPVAGPAADNDPLGIR